MGEAKRKLVAQRKLLTETKLVELDLEDIEYAMSEADIRQLTTVDAPPAMAATRLLLAQVIQAAYPDGMDRKMGRFWAGWQEVLSVTPVSTVISVTEGQLEWMRQTVANENTKVANGVVQWREALCDFLDKKSAAMNASPAQSVA